MYWSTMQNWSFRSLFWHSPTAAIRVACKQHSYGCEEYKLSWVCFSLHFLHFIVSSMQNHESAQGRLMFFFKDVSRWFWEPELFCLSLQETSEFHVISLNNFYTALYIFTALSKILSKPAARKVVFHRVVFEISV